MSHPLSSSQLAAALEAGHQLPARHWHPSGFKVSVWASLLMGLAIALFFIWKAGWAPPPTWDNRGEIAVSWVLITYIWIQVGSLVLVGAGNRNQMWVDALTSMVPLFLIFYVLLQHYAGYVELSRFQVNAALLVAYTMLLDVVVDLGISVLLSRQIVDVGGGSGVG